MVDVAEGKRGKGEGKGLGKGEEEFGEWGEGHVKE